MTGFKNCHARGVTSIVLRESPMLRAFVATPGHSLWRNHPYPSPWLPLSVGYHPHHCDITLIGVSGTVFNLEPYFLPGAAFREYRFESPIRGAPGAFRDTGRKVDIAPNCTALRAGECLPKLAAQVHTVFVPKHERAVWLVEEGIEDPDYLPICFSNDDLTKWSPEGLYVPMSDREVREAIRENGLASFVAEQHEPEHSRTRALVTPNRLRDR